MGGESTSTSKMRRAQIWFTDFMIGVMIFGIVIFIYYNSYGNLINQSETLLEEMVLDSKSISSSLVSAGFPSNWDSSTVERIGLTNGDYTLNPIKLNRFLNFSYADAKRLLNTRFDYYFFLEDSNGTISSTFGSPPLNEDHLVQVTRLVMLVNSSNGTAGGSGGGECAVDADCPAGDYCDEETCKEIGGGGGGDGDRECYLDEHCGSGDFCEEDEDDSECEEAEGDGGGCELDSECPIGDYCNEGTCETTGGGGQECYLDVHCAAEQICSSGTCVDTALVTKDIHKMVLYLWQ